MITEASFTIIYHRGPLAVIGHGMLWMSIFLKCAIPGLFFLIFVFSIQLTVNVQYKILQMTGFEPRASGIGSERSTNWATPLPDWCNLGGI